MVITPLTWTPTTGWSSAPFNWPEQPAFVLYFGPLERLSPLQGPVAELLEKYPEQIVAGCSTAGTIDETTIDDDRVAVSIVELEDLDAHAESLPIGPVHEHKELGTKLVRALLAYRTDLKHVIVFSDGIQVDGPAFAAGLAGYLPSGVFATGGLAGDGLRFQNTLVGLGRDIKPRQVVAVGLYGEQIDVQFETAGGWEPFGPTLEVNAADGHVLKKVEGERALDLYRRYLGDRVACLPVDALHYPFQVVSDKQLPVIRSVVAYDETAGTLTLSGRIAPKDTLQLCRTTGEELVERSRKHAIKTPPASSLNHRLALVVGSIGRRHLLKERSAEDLAAARHLFGRDVKTLGFYAYGELGPTPAKGRGCMLHNQTLAVTVLSEKPPKPLTL